MLPGLLLIVCCLCYCKDRQKAVNRLFLGGKAHVFTPHPKHLIKLNHLPPGLIKYWQRTNALKGKWRPRVLWSKFPNSHHLARACFQEADCSHTPGGNHVIRRGKKGSTEVLQPLWDSLIGLQLTSKHLDLSLAMTSMTMTRWMMMMMMMMMMMKMMKMMARDAEEEKEEEGEGWWWGQRFGQCTS